MSRVLTLSVHSANDVQNKVAAIKGVRGLTKLGLKEAKELVERINPGHREIIRVDHSVMEPDYSSHLNNVKAGGLTVTITDASNPVRKGIAEELRKLVTFATMSAQYDIAKSLIDVIETHCPEPADEFLEKDEESKDD